MKRLNQTESANFELCVFCVFPKVWKKTHVVIIKYMDIKDNALLFLRKYQKTPYDVIDESREWIWQIIFVNVQ